MTTAISMLRTCAVFGDWPTYRVNEKGKKAVHLLYPQFLRDDDPAERALGTQMGLQLLGVCNEQWICGDRISEGMAAEIVEAKRLGIPRRFVSREEITSAMQAQSAECGSCMAFQG